MKKHVRIMIPIIIFIAVAGFILFFPDVSSPAIEPDPKYDCKNGIHNYNEINTCSICGSLMDYTKGLSYSDADDGMGYLITGIGSAEQTDIVIPSGYNGKYVVGIGREAFKNKAITSVKLPESVKIIENGAFYNCGRLVKVEFSDKLEIIEANAFADCTKLDGLILPDSVTEIGDAAFLNCSCLLNITIGDNITVIGSGAFLRTDYWNACEDELVYIGNYLLGARAGAGDFTVKDGTTLIAAEAFLNADIESVTIPDSVKYIGKEAFGNCSKLKTVTMSKSISELPSYVFRNCKALEEIVISKNVTKIGKNAFYDCFSLNRVIFEEPGGWQTERKVINSEVLKDPIHAAVYLKNSNLTMDWERTANTENISGTKVCGESEHKYTVQNTCSVCGVMLNYTNIFSCGTDINGLYYASVNGLVIKNENLPTSDIVVPIGLENKTIECISGLNGYTNVKSVWLPDSIKYIGAYGFSQTSIRSIKLPANLIEIYMYSFASCRSLEAITIPRTVRGIYKGSFQGCSSLSSVVFEEGCAITEISDFLFEKTAITSIEIPAKVTVIGESAFADCTSLTEIFIPKTVAKIEANAFNGCSSLEKVIFEDPSGWIINGELYLDKTFSNPATAAVQLKYNSGHTWVKQEE